jgi:hypothetical protein
MRLMNACSMLGVYAALALLSGCASESSAPVMPQPPANAGAFAPHRDGKPSWMAADLARSDLLYVSDVGTGDVNVYSYPQGRLRGQLTGFVRPSGLCVDRHGDVYVTDLFASQIVEFPHGSTTPLRTIKDPNEDPGDCAVDPSTGNLAVSNVSTPYSASGDVVIFDRAKGRPHAYHDPTLFYYQFCGYDGVGNLYVDGVAGGQFALAELPDAGKKFTNITVDQKIAFAGAVAWDGKDLAVGDYEANVIYEFSISGSTGKTVGETHLKGADYPVGFWLAGATVIGPNDEGANVMFWNYPAGGRHTKIIRDLSKPWGAAVSPAR